MHAAATSKVENLAQGSSCKLKFVHAHTLSLNRATVKSRMQEWRIVLEMDIISHAGMSQKSLKSRVDRMAHSYQL